MRETGSNNKNLREAQNSINRKKREEKKRRRKRRIITFIILQIIATFLIVGYSYVYRKYSQIQRIEFSDKNVVNKDISVENIKKMEGYWNIAVFGVDSRNSSVGKGNHADVIMIVSINRSNGNIKLMSIYRDSYLDTGNKLYKMNNAYFEGGPEQAVRALNRNLDLNITDYVTVSWKAVATAINLLGGVDIEITKPEFRYINGYITETVKSTDIGSVHLKSPGKQHLDGIQAVAYARLRYMDTDYERTERQKRVLAQAFEKAKALDLNTLNQMADIILPMVATNLDWKDAVVALGDLKRYNITETSGFPEKRAEAMMGKKGWVIIPRTLESNARILHEFLFGTTDYEPSKTLKNIEYRIDADYQAYKNGAFKVESSSESETKESIKASEDITKSTRASYETDENGETVYLYETDENGETLTRESSESSGTASRESSQGESRTNESVSGSSTSETRENRPGADSSTTSRESRPGATVETSRSNTAATIAPTAPTNRAPSTTAPTTTAETRGPSATTERATTAPYGPTSSNNENTNISPGSNTQTTISPRSPGDDITTINAGPSVD